MILANRLHATSIDGQSFRAEKDALIAELEQAKLNSDEARRRAEEANLAKSRFLATMSHELRTPLNAILGFSEVMKAELFGAHAVPSYKEYSEDIHSSGQHLLMLINEILDLSRVEAGRYELREESVALVNIVEECRHLARHARQKQRHQRHRGARRRTAADLGGRARRAPGDAQSAEQRHQIHAAGRIGHDQGGMDAARAANICRSATPGLEYRRRKFRSCCPRSAAARSPRRTPTKAPASGLPIVKGLVELHGGEFKLLSKVREGTEVIVIFPPERVMNALPQLDPNAPEPPSQREPTRRPMRRAAA